MSKVDEQPINQCIPPNRTVLECGVRTKSLVAKTSADQGRELPRLAPGRHRQRSCSDVSVALLHSLWLIPPAIFADRGRLPRYQLPMVSGNDYSHTRNAQRMSMPRDLSPGPPTERHSVAGVLVSRGADISPPEVSAFARVQQSVAKKAVLASPSLDARVSAKAPLGQDMGASSRGGARQAVRYVTLQFHSVSSRGV